MIFNICSFIVVEIKEKSSGFCRHSVANDFELRLTRVIQTCSREVRQ